MKEMLNKFGVDSIDQLKKKLGEEHQARIVETGNNNKLTRQLDESLKKNTDLVDSMIKVSLGQYGRKTKADRFFRLLRTYNYTNMLGMVVRSSITDFGMPLIKNGPFRTIVEGWGGGMRDMLTGMRAMKIKDLRDLNVGLEAEMENTLRQILDSGYQSPMVKSTAEKVGDFIGNVVSTIFGIKHYTLMGRRIAGRTTQSHIIP